MRVLDLFSGIGGFSLGLERAGMKTVAFCEIDPFCRRVLAKHWPGVPQYDDIRTLTAERLAADGIAVDVICGGFPCQDISFAGKGAGIEGERSGLWSEYARLIGELRPEFVIVENVSALLVRGLDRVLGDLATLRFDAEWHCIPASAIGAPHIRDRVWIIAQPQHTDADQSGSYRTAEYEYGDTEPFDEQICISGPLGEILADAKEPRREQSQEQTNSGPIYWKSRDGLIGSSQDVANPFQSRLEGGAILSGYIAEELAAIERNGEVCDTDNQRQLQSQGSFGNQRRWPSYADWWQSEPNVGRVANGVPSRVDRLRGLGNAVVPQIPELIGRAIMEAHRDTRTD